MKIRCNLVSTGCYEVEAKHYHRDLSAEEARKDALKEIMHEGFFARYMSETQDLTVWVPPHRIDSIWFVV